MSVVSGTNTTLPGVLKECSLVRVARRIFRKAEDDDILTALGWSCAGDCISFWDETGFKETIQAVAQADVSACKLDAKLGPRFQRMMRLSDQYIRKMDFFAPFTCLTFISRQLLGQIELWVPIEWYRTQFSDLRVSVKDEFAIVHREVVTFFEGARIAPEPKRSKVPIEDMRREYVETHRDQTSAMASQLSRYD
jgi:hypothetical protein